MEGKNKKNSNKKLVLKLKIEISNKCFMPQKLLCRVSDIVLNN